MDDDRALYRRWLDRRDAAAFATLVRRHADLVHDVAWRVAGDHAAAEDALQESLIRLATDGTPRPAEVGFRAWLARAAIDRAKNARRADRSRAARERTVGETRKEAVVDAQPAVDSEAVRDVEAALRRGDGDDAAILTLRFRHGVEYPELAAILDVSEGAARVRVHRATEALRRDEALVRRDGPTIERALAGVPLAAAPAASLTSAIDVAIGAAGTSGAAGAGAGASAGAAGSGALASLAALVPGGFAALFAVAIVVAGGAFVLARSKGDARRADSSPGTGELARGDADSSRAADARPPAAALAAPPRVDRAAMGDRVGPSPDSDEPTVPSTQPPLSKKEVVPGSPIPAGKLSPDSAPRPVPAVDPSVASAPHPSPSSRSLRVRAVLTSPEGPAIPIAIEYVTFRGARWRGSVAEEGHLSIPTSLGYRSFLNVTTKDPRALVSRIYVALADPAPDTLVVRFPAVSDSRLDPLVLEILEAKSETPIRGATLEWQWPGTRIATMTADSAGRIPIATTTGADGVAEQGIHAFIVRGFTLHAPGLRSTGRFAWREPSATGGDLDGLPIGLDQADVDAWSERGMWIVRLDRLPEYAESRTLRVLHDDGRPAIGALVYLSAVAPSRVLKALGAAVTPNDVDFGLRRVGADGVIEYGARDRTAMEVFIENCPVGVFALSRDRWPASGPREVRLAPLADVTLTIDGIPDDKPASWMFDPLGSARTPADGSTVPITWDDGFDPKTREDEFSVFTFIGQRDLSGDLKPGRSEIRFRYPVGWARPLYVRVGDGYRRFVVRTPATGPVHLDAHWDEMEDSNGPLEGRMPGR